MIVLRLVRAGGDLDGLLLHQQSSDRAWRTDAPAPPRPASPSDRWHRPAAPPSERCRSTPAASVIWVTTFPARAAIPPSTDISRLLPAAVRFTSAIFMVMGGMVPMVMLYLAQLPTVILERSVAIGVGGPWVICADAAVGEPTATATIEATKRRASKAWGTMHAAEHRRRPERRPSGEPGTSGTGHRRKRGRRSPDQTEPGGEVAGQHALEHPEADEDEADGHEPLERQADEVDRHLRRRARHQAERQVGQPERHDDRRRQGHARGDEARRRGGHDRRRLSRRAGVEPTADGQHAVAVEERLAETRDAADLKEDDRRQQEVQHAERARALLGRRDQDLGDVGPAQGVGEPPGDLGGAKGGVGHEPQTEPDQHLAREQQRQRRR